MYQITQPLFAVLRTLVLYGAGPILFANKRKKPISRKKLITLSILYTFLVWLIFSLLRMLLLDLEPASTTAAALWGGIFLRRSVRILWERNLLK